MHQKIKLKSKRNQVHRIIEDNRSYIKKTFTESENMRKEIQVLRALKKEGCNVPEILEVFEDTLYLEDLGEVTLLDWYERKEKENTVDYVDMIEKLCEWMKSFYSITYNCYDQSMILSDVNFRNFLIKDNEIYGIDFEESHAGNIETDAGKLAAFSMTYHPEMTKWKLRFAEELEKILSLELNLNKELVMKEKEKELRQIKNRRGCIMHNEGECV